MMNVLTQISIAAWCWSAVFAVRAVVSLWLRQWTIALLTGLLALFFARYGVSTFVAAGHDVDWIRWAMNRNLILTQITMGVLLTIGNLAELLYDRRIKRRAAAEWTH